MKKLIITLNLLLFVFLTSCTMTSGGGFKTIEITKESVVVDELDCFVGDEFKLDTKMSDNSNANIIWESSNPNIVSIDDEGNVEILRKGSVIISAFVNGTPYINDAIFIDSTRKLEQLGVGSGHSKDDPIFIGNEGEEEPLEIYFIEMQHIYADSIFIKKGNVEILIDSGYEYDGDFVNKVIMEHCTDGILDVLMLSHSDGDHIDGLVKALNNVEKISLMVDYGGSGTGNTLITRNKYIPNGTIYHSAYDSVNKLNGATDVYYLTEDFYFEVLNTGSYIEATDSSASNPHSLAVIFYYHDFTFFTAGDITTATEAKLLQNEDLPEVTLYKASHHGSHGSNSQELLDTLNPKAVAISASRANQYQAKPGKPTASNTYNLNGASGHPAAAAIERIYKAPNISQNLNVFWNAINGTMKFTTYGEDDFEFQGSPTMKGYYDLSLTNGVAKWNEALQDFENKVTGEENKRLHETKAFIFRDYIQYLPDWAKEKYFPEY